MSDNEYTQYKMTFTKNFRFVFQLTKQVTMKVITTLI